MLRQKKTKKRKAERSPSPSPPGKSSSSRPPRPPGSGDSGGGGAAGLVAWTLKAEVERRQWDLKLPLQRPEHLWKHLWRWGVIFGQQLRCNIHPSGVSALLVARSGETKGPVDQEEEDPLACFHRHHHQDRPWHWRCHLGLIDLHRHQQEEDGNRSLELKLQEWSWSQRRSQWSLLLIWHNLFVSSSRA